jgi:hypothetical protein
MNSFNILFNYFTLGSLVALIIYKFQNSFLDDIFYSFIKSIIDPNKNIANKYYMVNNNKISYGKFLIELILLIVSFIMILPFLLFF